nr:MAG TPA: hypothetical protein [Caudoviricetes sp.]
MKNKEYKLVTMKANIKFTIEGEQLEKFNQRMKEKNLTLDEAADHFNGMLIELLKEELFDCEKLYIDVNTKIIEKMD